MPPKPGGNPAANSWYFSYLAWVGAPSLPRRSRSIPTSSASKASLPFIPVLCGHARTLWKVDRHLMHRIHGHPEVYLVVGGRKDRNDDEGWCVIGMGCHIWDSSWILLYSSLVVVYVDVLLPGHEDILLFIMEMPCEGGFSGELMISLLSAPGREQAQETMTRDEKGFVLSGDSVEQQVRHRHEELHGN